MAREFWIVLFESGRMQVYNESPRGPFYSINGSEINVSAINHVIEKMAYDDIVGEFEVAMSAKKLDRDILITRLTALEKVAAEMAGALVNACDLISALHCNHGHVDCGDHDRCYASEQHRALTAYNKFIEKGKGG